MSRLLLSRRRMWRFAGAAVLSGGAFAAGRERAPDFELRDAQGVKRRLSEFRGKVVILNFWATWCAPCRKEIPLLNRIHQAYARRGLTVLGIAMDERGWPAVTPFLEREEVDYPVLLGNAAVARRYGGLKVLPRTLFLDRNGGVVAAYEALLAEGPLRRIVEMLLAEPPGPAAPGGR